MQEFRAVVRLLQAFRINGTAFSRGCDEFRGNQHGR